MMSSSRCEQLMDRCAKLVDTFEVNEISLTLQLNLIAFLLAADPLTISKSVENIYITGRNTS